MSESSEKSSEQEQELRRRIGAGNQNEKEIENVQELERKLSVDNDTIDSDHVSNHHP